MSLPDQSIEEAPQLYFKHLNPQRHKVEPQRHLFLAKLSDRKIELVKELIKELEVNEERGSLPGFQDESANVAAIGSSHSTKEESSLIEAMFRRSKDTLYISLSSKKVAEALFNQLTENKDKYDVHAQYAKKKKESDFLHGLDNLSSCTNLKRIESIPGLMYFEDFITKDEEKLISESIYTIPFHNDQFSEGIGRDIKRKVWHFGYEFRYSNNSAGRPSIPLPRDAQFLVSRLIDLGKTNGFIKKDKHFRYAKGDLLDMKQDDLELCTDEYYDIPNQCTVNQYRCGEGISPHVDNAEDFSTWVASLSMLSESVMCFKDQSKDDKNRIEVILPPRSLLVLTGDARYKYLHSIPQRQYDAIDGVRRKRNTRLSITFRHAYTLGKACNLVTSNLELEQLKRDLNLINVRRRQCS